jgi:hypothetical protein
MTLAFSASTPADIDDIAAFLIHGFNAPPDAIFANRDVLRWKYFDAGPQWESSRSYVLRKENEIKAHCAVWPMNLEFKGEQISCLSFIDWLSEPDLPGAGVLLKKKLMKMAATSVVVGGSDDTRAVVPRIGFAHVSDVTTFARVIRPLTQQRSRPREKWTRRTARLLRNTAWSWKPLGSVDSDWSVNRVDTFLSVPQELGGGGHPTPWRSSDYLNYWLRNPAVDIAGFQIIRNGTYYGYFLLSNVGGQARIADMRLMSDDAEDWAMAYRLAVSVAEQNPSVCEVITIASTQLVSDALKASGFQDRGRVPFFFADPGKKLAGAPPVFLNLIDGDGAYLYDPQYPFVT